MKLHNTLTRKIEEFKPLQDKIVTLYSCGPTVYDYMHIGNLRKFVFDDTLRRALEANGYKTKHAMNITDVGHLVSDSDEGEDKLEKGAKREGKTVWDVAKHYTDSFKKDVAALNILKPNVSGGPDNYAKATDFIPEQIEMIKILLEKGFAYETPKAIYFDVSKLKNYGELTGQKLSDKEVAVRSDVVTDKNKRNPQDFALWFFTVDRFAHHDMHWSSPWGEGFPGWHLECSAIIHTLLGDPIDIHTGGVDNIGTHHVNEMAQTEAAFGHKLANYWVHCEHLLVNDQKMSKSLGNFYTLVDVIKKDYDPLALRLLFLQSHYRSQMNFSWESLDGAAEFLKKLRAWADLKFQSNLGHKKGAGDSYKEALEHIQSAVNEDLNTAQALAILAGQASLAEQEGANPDKLQPLLERLDELFGLNLSSRDDITDPAKRIIGQREQMRRDKNWSEADRLRDELAEQGIAVEDTEHGPVWSRTDA
ncbi:MAG TPA: cysteine--tRNA ligase [Candidatus Saccharimonadales bacterium]|nr:cysteine--tRNA ligase [Candidatus Saccharimonadales bacterium]